MRTTVIVGGPRILERRGEIPTRRSNFFVRNESRRTTSCFTLTACFRNIKRGARRNAPPIIRGQE
jgi:hypothetical protein